MTPREPLTVDEMRGIVMQQLGDFYMHSTCHTENHHSKPNTIECEWYRTEDRGDGEAKYWYRMELHIRSVEDITDEVQADVDFHTYEDDLRDTDEPNPPYDTPKWMEADPPKRQIRMLIIRTDGSIEQATVDADNTDEGTAKIEDAVGGYFECLEVRSGLVGNMTLWFLEDPATVYDPGIHKTNAVASLLAGTELIGTAVVTGSADDEGNSLDLTDEQIKHVEHQAALV